MASPKPVDGSLWWDSFVLLFEELDAAPLSSDLTDPLLKKIKSNHAWFLDSVTCFKPPNRGSRLALDSPEISAGSHRLVIKPDLKEAAFRVSKCLCLDEVQSYILVTRSFELKNSVADIEGQEFLHLILLQYYLERQCLLKCVRRIFVHALYMGNGSSTEAIRLVALQLVHDGMEKKLFSILQDLFSSVPSEKTEVDFTVLWVEESLIEDNLVLDILFLSYYDNFCSCNVEQWKALCSLFKGLLSGSFNVGKLAVSVEARNSFLHAKAQLLLILIETMDLENLLQMVHDEVPFRQGSSIFSLSDVQEIDAVVSCFSDLGTVEAGPLILAWAVFVCILLSLPDRIECNILLEIDHIGYVRQAFEAAPFNYLLDILRSDTLRDSDGPVSGYLSVLRTLTSAFIASYDLNHQTDDSTLNMVLETICEIYHGEESLSMQFWDRDSFVDAPIRSLLYMIERDYPFPTAELIRLLLALCEGAWAAECVYNFLDKMSGITLPFEIPGGSCVVNVYDIIETLQQLCIPGAEGLIIPSGTRGHVLKIIDANFILVHWECARSGIFLLLLHLAQEPHPDNYEELLLTLNLLYRMVSLNVALCFSVLHIDKSLSIQAAQRSGYIDKNVRVDAVKIICTLIFNFVQDVSNAGVVSICINILAEMLKCAPTRVIEVALRSNIFRTEINSSSSGTWLLSGGLARMLLADCGENVECFPLTISVLDFTIQLVEKGAEDNMVSALVVFCLQYVLVNHLNWNYKLKYGRWKVTLKVLDVMKSCIKAIHVSGKLGCMIRDILLYDSSIHNILCRIICISTHALERSYVIRHFDLKEIEGLQLTLCSALDIVYSLLVVLSKEIFSNAPTFVQTMLSSAAKPIPVVAAAISLISFFQNSALQDAAAKVLSMLCYMASKVQSNSVENVSFVVNAMQIRDLSAAVYGILDGEQNKNDDLLVTVFNLLISAARYQPALLVCVLLADEEVEVPLDTAGDVKKQLALAPVIRSLNSSKARSIDSILKFLAKSEVLIKCAPNLLLSILNLLKSIWEGGVQYIQLLEKIRSSEMFWKNLSSILVTDGEIGISAKGLNSDEIECTGYRYQCQGTVLEIMAHELFLQEKVLQGEMLEKTTSILEGKIENRLSNEVLKSSNTIHLKGILSTWCESSTMDKLIKSYTSSRYDNKVIHHSKIAVCMCMVHLVDKLSPGNAGSLSISLVEKIGIISNKLSEHPAFSALLGQYSSRRYSEGKQLTNLVLNDLYYHLQGELEGREIAPGHFLELSHFLLDMGIFQLNDCNCERNIWSPDNTVHKFDIPCLRARFGMDQWDYLDWNVSKEVAERMFLRMRDANIIMFLTYSQRFALKALTTIIHLYDGNIPKTKSLIGREISEPLIESSIGHLCKCLQAIQDSILPALSPHADVLKFATAQAKLLLVLSRILFRRYSQRTATRSFLPLSVCLIKSSGLGIKFFADIRPSTTELNLAVKLLLMLLLSSVEFCYPVAYAIDKSDLEVKLFSEVSMTSMGLLPVLCKYIGDTEFSDLSVASVDLMLKGFLAPNIWLPILQKHLQLQHVVQKIQQKDAPVSFSGILNFLLTLACIKGGAELLHSCNIFSSLKVLFSHLLNDNPFSNNLDESGFPHVFSNAESHGYHWGLGLAIVSSMINALGDDFSCTDIVDSAICYFFSEKAYIMSSYLSAPTFPADDHSKKRTRTSKTQTSLTELRLTEHTLMLMCVLARHQASWIRGMKERDSELRETSIHLLAFISRGPQRIGDLPFRTVHPLCSPTLKEEVDLNGRPSFVNSKNGWFTLSAVGISTKAKVFAASSPGLSLAVKDRPNDNADLACHTHFSDTVAIQIYRIAFLVLKFLCTHAKAAARRAEDVEFIDLAHFPELPMPEILHGLQDQAIAIVTEVCEVNRSKSIQQELEGLCLLLLQILEKSLYLELCVSQSCGIRPVLGRIEHFSKEFKQLMQVVEHRTNLKASLRSLGQIITLVYPGLLQTDGLF